MESRSLKVFCAVAETRSVVAAAGKVHLTASAVSHSLKSLETELGCRLFERVGKRMALNHAGEQLLAQVRGPLAALDAAAEEIRRLGKWGQIRLRLGAPAAACEHILPRVIRELKRAHASIELHIEAADTPQLIDLLHENKLDLALGPVPANCAGLALRPAFRDELLFVFAAGHPWASARTITRDEILSQRFILYRKSSLTARLLDDYFHRLQIAPVVAMEVASTAAILELVRTDLGVSVLPPWAAERELARGTVRMRALGPKPLWRRWAVLSLASHRMALAEETFCRLCANCPLGLRLDRHDLPAPK